MKKEIDEKEINAKEETAGEKKLMEKMYDRLEDMAETMEKMRLAEYVLMLQNPKRLLFINFLFGLARGFGMAIGFTLLAAIVIYFLQQLLVLNMPVLGDFIADLVRIVQDQTGTLPLGND